MRPYLTAIFMLILSCIPVLAQEADTKTKQPPVCAAQMECTLVSSSSQPASQGASAENTYITVFCPEGYLVTGGGIDHYGSGGRATGYPNDQNGWTCKLRDTTEAATCYAQCCKVTVMCE